MELNNIQRKIRNEYLRYGQVWADCPRQSGKTEILIDIAKDELLKGNKIFIKSINHNNEIYIVRRLAGILQFHEEKAQELFDNIVINESDADIIIYDEVYYDIITNPTNKNIICLRTRQHRILTFTYLDIDDKEKKNEIIDLVHMIPKKQWNLEFNNGENETIGIE